MSFELKHFNLSDLAKVESDLKSFDLIKSNLSTLRYCLDNDYEQLYWAIDEKSNHYLVYVPSIVYDGRSASDFIFYNGSVFIISLCIFGSEVIIDGKFVNKNTDLTGLKLGLSQAFQVHGKSGRLQQNLEKYPENQFQPEFKISNA